MIEIRQDGELLSTFELEEKFVRSYNAKPCNNTRHAKQICPNCAGRTPLLRTVGLSLVTCCAVAVVVMSVATTFGKGGSHVDPNAIANQPLGDAMHVEALREHGYDGEINMVPSSGPRSVHK